MAETPQSRLVYYDASQRSCFRCADRIVDLPLPLPNVGDDFDWRVRDYDGFRQFMLEELAARFPERKRWTAADVEIAIIESVAAQLDQLSDMADRVFSEAYLETARTPSSLRRLLGLIGYDAAAMADALGQIDIDAATPVHEVNRKLEEFWESSSYAMEEARLAGPKSIRTQHRMVSLADYAERLEDHPLVLRAKSETRWTGSWSTLFAATMLWDSQLFLDNRMPDPGADENSDVYRRVMRLRDEIRVFNEKRRIPIPDWTLKPSARMILRPYIELYRQAGQEVVLQDAVPAPITLVVSINVNRNYFASEVKMAARETLGKGPNGFFEPGRLRFGEDLFASDVIAVLMKLDGIDNVCVIRFKRTGSEYPDETASGRISLSGLEVAICENLPGKEAQGYISLKANGGLR